jgi:release factor glutamine methyltransferase
VTEPDHQISIALAAAARFLGESGVPEPRVDAEILLSHALAWTREELLARLDEGLSHRDLQKFNRFVSRRGDRREPVAYIVGVREFYGLRLKVTPAVLIPRPETEVLVERAIALRPGRVLDLGTGSGAIAAALAAHLPDAHIIATDASDEALAVARKNLPKRVEIRHGRDFQPTAGEPFDLVVSNPPYIPTAEIDRLEPEVRHEPRIALDGGPDGLDVVRRILRSGKKALIEIGQGQADVLRSEFPGVRFHRDLAGIERVVER